MPKATAPKRGSEKPEDNAWKDTVSKFFPEFIEFFYPQVFADIDWARGYTLLDKELARLTRQHKLGSRLADLLAKVYLRDGRETWLLIHIEIQSKPEAGFPERIYVYNYRIFDKHHCEVVSLALLTGASRSSHSAKYQRKRWGFELVCRFPVVKLRDYEGRWGELMASPNPFAVAVMAYLRVWQARKDEQRRLSYKRELIRLLYARGYDRETVWALLRFIDWIIVLPEELEQEIEEEIAVLEEERQMPYISRMETRWLNRGIARGIEQGERRLVLSLLQAKLGELDEETRAQIDALPNEKIPKLGSTLLRFTELKDLTNWLKRHQPRPANKRALKATAQSKQ